MNKEDAKMLDIVKDRNDGYTYILKVVKYNDMDNNQGFHIYIGKKDYIDQKEVTIDGLIIYGIDCPETAKYVLTNYKYY